MVVLRKRGYLKRYSTLSNHFRNRTSYLKLSFHVFWYINLLFSLSIKTFSLSPLFKLSVSTACLGIVIMNTFFLNAFQIVGSNERVRQPVYFIIFPSFGPVYRVASNVMFAQILPNMSEKQRMEHFKPELPRFAITFVVPHNKGTYLIIHHTVTCNICI